MLNVLVGLIADNVLVKYDVHSARLNDGNELVFFLKNRLTKPQKLLPISESDYRDQYLQTHDYQCYLGP